VKRNKPLLELANKGKSETRQKQKAAT